jgi:hypothetical protein
MMINTKRALALAVALTSQVGAALAGPPEVSKQVVAPPPPPPAYFRANEWDLGVFATYAKGVGGDINRGLGEHAWGGGLSGAYFPWLYAGFRIQGSVVDVSRHDTAAGWVSGDFLLRYPLDSLWPNVHLAPYAFAGVGGFFSDLGDHFDEFGFHHHHGSDNRVMGNFGGGIEYRFTPHIGIFTEAAYDVVDGAKNNFVPINFGLKFAF